MGDSIFYRRNLPHFQPKEATFFVTFRLADSLPRKVIEDLRLEFDKSAKEIRLIKNPSLKAKGLYHHEKRYFGKFDALLDGSKYGSSWLKNPKIADFVYNLIMIQNRQSMKLFAFCIMPNHVHMLFELSHKVSEGKIIDVKKYPVTHILKSIKGQSGKKANNVLNRAGRFWARESYDHVVRDETEFENIYYYILMNPVKAGLVKKWQGWKWTYSCYL